MKTALSALKRTLPKGQTLPDETWERRHAAIVRLLWAHAAIVPIFALIRGYSVQHTIIESLVLPVTAVLAGLSLGRRARTIAASVGLLSASGILVHLSGGLIEMHFHFFVMVAVVALYQEWVPFLTSIGYVLVHHGVVGALDPHSVFNHPAAIAHPWRWAAIHAFFIAGISVACLVNWRLNETMLTQRREVEQRLVEESRIVETLNETGKALAGELDRQTLVQRVTDAATSLTNAAFGAFFYNVIDDEGESYMLYTISGVDPAAFADFPMPRNTPIFAPTFRGEGVVRVDDITKDSRYGKVPPYHGMPKGHLKVCSYLAVPVRSRTGDVIGGLFFGHPEPARFTAVHERLAVGIAAHAAIAIDNSTLYESERRAREAAEAAQHRFEMVAEASRALSSSLELDRVLRNFARAVAPAIADSCEIHLADDEGLRLVAWYAEEEMEQFAGSSDYRPDLANLDEPVARTFRTRETTVVEDITDEFLIRALPDVNVRAIARQFGPTSVIVVPLVRRKQVLGTLSIGTNRRSDRRMTQADVGLVEELGRRVAIAIENASLFATQRTAAETLQHSLLPEQLPDIPGLEMRARYIAGGPGVEVGGDWYDVITLRDGSLGLAMGDVVGRGVKAASLMGQLRNALRAYAMQGCSPGEMLRRLNDLLYDVDDDDSPMVTLLYAVFEHDTGTIRIANAGHPPPLVVALDGTASYLDGTGGVPLGAVPATRFTETLTSLPLGATIVLYTDGLVEDRETPLYVGMRTLRRVAEETGPDVDALCEALIASSPVKGGTDDVAILAVRSQPLGDRLDLTIPTKPGVLGPLRATLRRWLGEGGASEVDIFDIVLSAGEAAANAIQHGGLSATSFHISAVRGETDGQSDIRITVRDRGRWRTPQRTLGGRGLEIIEKFMDESEVIRHGDGTEVRMRKVLQSSRASEVSR